ncbi:MAG TPA: hypothetical protein VKF63_04485, partial [Terracidiphilus sp.]|nr:hypothetical protein [Terracidiphilus sp.]
WFDDLWLVDSAPEVTTLTILREEIISAIPDLGQVFLMAMEGDKKQVAGLLPVDSHEWLKEHWLRKVND